MQLLESIGNTPCVRLDSVWIKMEHLNPSGSVKDRIARFIVEKAEQSGQLKKGYRIVEATSGNTGIAFAMIGALKGYPVTIVMPKGLSRERKQMMLAFGADVIETHENCVKCAVEKTLEIAETNKKVFLPKQFENRWNWEEHQHHFAKELFRQVEAIDAFVAGVGTGGTLIGTGKAIRKRFPSAKLIAVEPAECPLLSKNQYGRHQIHGLHKGFTCRKHGIEGIGDGFIPKIVEENRELIDSIITVKTTDAQTAAAALAQRGYFVGPSSGANFLAAKKTLRQHQNVVTLFCDRGERYLSEQFFSGTTMKKP